MLKPTHPIPALCASVLLAALSAAALAGPQAKPAKTKGHHHRSLYVRQTSPLRHQVVVADQLVMVIDAPAAGQTAAQRVDAINDRLVSIIASEPLLPRRMRLSTQGGQTVILVGTHLLTSVTSADARANQTTVPTLAHFWLANCKRVLPQARPPAPLP